MTDIVYNLKNYMYLQMSDLKTNNVNNHLQ